MLKLIRLSKCALEIENKIGVINDLLGHPKQSPGRQ